ncbi:MAG: long-chain fatty acid--CoA ligase [Deltaproteobacteria bacterium]|nr:long-chain fatty acid--CoA ligase [Deltaproteobacteria bacterium]MBW2416953.1 long-chain fatty acid--CoA ligase [Deltaproteobacteria bacterium]
MAREIDFESIGSIAQAFRRTAREHADRLAVRSLDGELELTWGGLRERVDALAGGLAELGLGRGDTMAIMLSNRPEFHVVDLAAMMLGGVPFSVYQTLSPEQIAFVVADSGARIAVIERAFLDSFSKAAQDLPSLEHVIVVDGEGEQGTLRLDEVERPGMDIDAAAAAIGADDLLTLIYTSGTTGPPKGVELTHGAMIATAEAFHDVIQFPDAARVISWLPSAHIAERAAHHYLPVIFGFSVTTCPDPRRIIEVLPQVRPHWFFAVPRIWEKIKAGLEARLASLPEEQRSSALAGLEAAKEKVRREQAGEPVPAELAEAVAAADEALFSKLRLMLGFDQAKAVTVGAAPTPPEVLEFFHAIGIPVGELWGMSETCGAGTTNPPGAARIGTVGPPVKGAEIRLADDGEILMRGPMLMRGYRNLPDKTRETINEEGWLLTGDLGAFDEQGYLRIIDRKKEIIINAAGKNMSPANIESTLKAAGPLLGQVCVIGDARPFNSALVVLDADYAPIWAEQQGLSERSLEALSREESVRAAIEAEIAQANEKLARVEQVKKFVIVPGDWLPGGDELTPTMKLKRRPIAEKYGELIESMYTG